MCIIKQLVVSICLSVWHTCDNHNANHIVMAMAHKYKSATEDLRPSLIAGLDCGLDRWTGLLDWIILDPTKLPVKAMMHV